MAKQEDVYQALALFHQHRANHAFEQMHKSEMGLVAVLRYLGEAEKQGKRSVTSREISDVLGVSSARMTVILKKLAQKQWITKASSPTDARAVSLALTPEGTAFCESLHKRLYHTMEQVVDALGIAELQRLMKNLEIIDTILSENRPTQLEETHV
ncbi:MAG: MarR family transcriptional regulator [Faecalibacterium sp.]